MIKNEYCSRGGIAEIRKMADDVVACFEEMKGSTERVRVFAEEYQDILGPHGTLLNALLTEIADSIKDLKEPSDELTMKLLEIFQTIIDGCNTTPMSVE